MKKTRTLPCEFEVITDQDANAKKSYCNVDPG